MASIEEQLVAAVKSLVSGRMYPLTAPDNPATPYLIYQNIVDRGENTLSDGVSINNARIQIDCFGTDYLALKTLAAQVTAVVVAGFSVGNSSARDGYESPVKLYRVMLDYSLWY